MKLIISMLQFLLSKNAKSAANLLDLINNERVTFKLPDDIPSCKRCGSPCAYYGIVGGYSVQCAECNKIASDRRRKNYAKRKQISAVMPKRKPRAGVK